MKQRAIAVSLAIPVAILAAMILADLLLRSCSPSRSSGPAIPYEDRRAYDELRKRGYTDSEARESAPSLRRLCQAADGTDCQ